MAAARKTPSRQAQGAIPIGADRSQRFPGSSTAQEHGGRGAVLVVDDEVSLRRLVVRILEGEGFSCVEACDGVDGLEAFERAPDAIDILLSDVTMPRMDGLELASRIAVVKPEVRVLIMSGWLENRPLRREWRFLAKPFGVSELLARIRELDQLYRAAAIEQRRAG